MVGFGWWLAELPKLKTMIDMIAQAIRANRRAVRGLTFVLVFPNFGILVTGVSPLLEGLRPSSQVAVGERPGNRSKTNLTVFSGRSMRCP